jgi:hypothetical protein
MLSSLLRPTRISRTNADGRSPFASPSPDLARQRAPPNERSQLLQNPNNAVTSGETSESDGEDEEHPDSNYQDEEVDDENEDGVRDETPLLPIFSAAHLGRNVPEPMPRQCSLTDKNQ